MGALGIVVPFAAIAWGTQHIASGLSAILNATMPLFTILLASLWGDETLSARRVAGIVFGFGGIVILTAQCYLINRISGIVCPVWRARPEQQGDGLVVAALQTNASGPKGDAYTEIADRITARQKLPRPGSKP